MDNLRRRKKPAACLSGVGLQRAHTAGNRPDASCGVPVETTSTRQSKYRSNT